MHTYMCMNTAFYSLLITLYYVYVCTCYRDGLALRLFFIKKSQPSFLLILAIYEHVHYFSGKSMSLVLQKICLTLLKRCKIIATWLKVSYWVSGSCLKKKKLMHRSDQPNDCRMTINQNRKEDRSKEFLVKDGAGEETSEIIHSASVFFLNWTMSPCVYCHWVL